MSECSSGTPTELTQRGDHHCRHHLLKWPEDPDISSFCLLGIPSHLPPLTLFEPMSIHRKIAFRPITIMVQQLQPPRPVIRYEPQGLKKNWQPHLRQSTYMDGGYGYPVSLVHPTCVNKGGQAQKKAQDPIPSLSEGGQKCYPRCESNTRQLRNVCATDDYVTTSSCTNHYTTEMKASVLQHI
jgi:hypothetical protein